MDEFIEAFEQLAIELAGDPDLSDAALVAALEARGLPNDCGDLLRDQIQSERWSS